MCAMSPISRWQRTTAHRAAYDFFSHKNANLKMKIVSEKLRLREASRLMPLSTLLMLQRSLMHYNRKIKHSYIHNQDNQASFASEREAGIRTHHVVSVSGLGLQSAICNPARSNS